MNVQAIEDQARKLASKAKPGYLKIDGKLYTFEFCQKEWIYKVYEDGFFFVNFNCKQLSKAKKMLQEYIAN